MVRSEKLLVIDVFSGCGGMSEGLRNAGFNVVAAIEIDKASSEVFKLNHPDTYIFNNDVRELEASDILKTVNLQEEKLDILAGCSPCQGFSRMRTRNRKKAVIDDRNDLVFDYVRLVEEIKPKTILFENVPGLEHDDRFSKMIKRLRDAGYSIDYQIINMADYGIPQRRRRLILVGTLLGEINIPKSKTKRLSVRETIGSLPKPEDSDDILHNSLSTHSEAVMERIREIPKDGGSRLDLGEEAQLECHKRVVGYNDVYGRMAWDKPAPTITRFCTNPSKGRYLHPEQDREITLREASLFQTFPETYKFPFDVYGRLAIQSMIGEAVPPKFAKFLGDLVRNHIESQIN